MGGERLAMEEGTPELKMLDAAMDKVGTGTPVLAPVLANVPSVRARLAHLAYLHSVGPMTLTATQLSPLVPLSTPASIILRLTGHMVVRRIHNLLGDLQKSPTTAV